MSTKKPPFNIVVDQESVDFYERLHKQFPTYLEDPRSVDEEVYRKAYLDLYEEMFPDGIMAVIEARKAAEKA